MEWRTSTQIWIRGKNRISGLYLPKQEDCDLRRRIPENLIYPIKQDSELHDWHWEKREKLWQALLCSKTMHSSEAYQHGSTSPLASSHELRTYVKDRFADRAKEMIKF